MITMTQMYWFTRLDSISCFFTVIWVLLLMILVVLSIAYPIAMVELYGDDKKVFRKKFTKPFIGVVVATIFFSLCAVFTPTTKEMAVIYVVPKIVNNQKVQQIPEKLIDLASGKLDEWAGKISKEDK